MNKLHQNLYLVITVSCTILISSSLGTPAPFSITIPGPQDTLQPDPSYLYYPKISSPGIALALSGGGARGFAHIGVLQALEEEDIPITLIVGTSCGALVGGFYASGYSATDLKLSILSLNWEEIFYNRPTRSSLFLTQKRLHGRHILQLRFQGLRPEIPLALSSGHELTQRLMGLIERAPYHPSPDFDHLAIPFRAITTDLYTGDEIIFRKGNLITALRASMSIPLIFTPLEYESKLLVDGGVSENIPVKAARQEGADLIVAVNTSAPGIDYRKPQIPWEIADRVTTIMQQEDNQDNLKMADVVIAPDVSDRSSTDFTNLEEIIDKGYQAAKDKIPEIKRLLARSFPAQNGDTIHFSKYQFTFTGVKPEDVDSLTYPPTAGSLTIGELTALLNAIYRSGRATRTQATWTGDTLKIHVDFTPTVESIEFRGNSLLKNSELRRLTSQPLHEPLNLNRGRKDLRQILNRYRSIGATQARIDTVLFDTVNGKLQIIINEGIITDIQVQGLKRVHRWGVLREFPLKIGNIFLVDYVERGIRQIYGSELFETAFMTTERTPNGVRLRIQVKEKKTRILRWGARADLERHGQTFLEYIDDNLFGVHIRLVMFGKYGEKDELYSASLISDRLFRTYLSLEVGGYLRKEEWSIYNIRHHTMGGYDFERTGGRFALGIQAGRWGQVSGGFRAERVLSSYLTQKHDMLLGIVELRAAIDTQDRTPFPNRGYSASWLYQSSGRFLTSDASYTKTDLQLDSYLEIARRHVVGLNVQWGFADATIPHSEKFRLGGQNSLLGFHEGELVGNARVFMGLCYRFDLISRFLADAYLTGHYTTGAVWNGADYSIRREDFLQSVGVSFSLNTLLGPISVTYGHLFPAQGYEKSDIIYFSTGHEF